MKLKRSFIKDIASGVISCNNNFHSPTIRYDDIYYLTEFFPLGIRDGRKKL
jgi:hypothetical protein